MDATSLCNALDNIIFLSIMYLFHANSENQYHSVLTLDMKQSLHFSAVYTPAQANVLPNRLLNILLSHYVLGVL